MGGFVEGADRHQASLLPVEDYAEADRGLMRDPQPDPRRILLTLPTVAVAMANEPRGRPKLSDDPSFSVLPLVLGTFALPL